MSMLRSRFNVTLIVGIIIMLLLMPIWYTMPVPSVSPLIQSELENLDATATSEGTFGKEGYLTCPLLYGEVELPILITAHLYVEEVKGDNIILNIEANNTRKDTGEFLSELSGNSTYVLNKLTWENVEDAPEADKPRRGYDPFLYPSHLRAGENISNVWLDYLNVTGTLEFKGVIKEEGIKLYRYFVNKTITKKMWNLLGAYTDCTLTSTKTVVIEPLSGMLVYTENETFDWVSTYKGLEQKLVYLTYTDIPTPEAKAKLLKDAKLYYGAMKALEVETIAKKTILGGVLITLVIALTLNVRRLKRIMPPK